jgi:hypothetical protein
MSSSPVTAGTRRRSSLTVVQTVLLASLLAGGCGSGEGAMTGADGALADVPTEASVDAPTDSDLPADAADAGTDSILPEEDAGPASPVQGRWWNRTVSVEGMGERPIDLSGGRVGVWTGRGRQRRWLPGTGDAQGNFQIPAVPGGPFLLDVRTTAGTRRLIASPGEQRTFALGFAEQRRSSTPRPPAGPGTVLELNLINLAPWKAGDVLSVLVNDGPAVYAQAGLAVDKTTSLARISQPSVGHVDGPGLGDEIRVVQTGRTDGEGGVSITRPRRVGSSREVKTVEGQTTSFTLPLQPVAETTTVSVDVRRSEFLPFQSQVSASAHPPRVTTAVHRVLPGLDTTAGGSGEVLSLTVPEGTTDVRLDGVTTGDSFPAEWSSLAVVSVSFPVPLELAGAMAPLVTSPGFSMADRAERLLGPPLRPLLSPPRELRIEGVTATGPLAQVGTTPTLSWQAPAVVPAAASGDAGAPAMGPVMYEISLRKLEAGPESISEIFVATLTTEDTSLHLPPELLSPGPWYRVLVNATVTVRSRLGAPMLRVLPQYEAATVSAPFTP